MTMMPDVLLDCYLFWVQDNESDHLMQVHMHIYILDAIYCYVVIGLMHIMEGVLVIYILSICWYSLHPPSSNKEYLYTLITS